MEAAPNIIDKLSRAELQQLKVLIEEKIAIYDREEQKSALVAEVEKHGYAFRKEEIECPYPHINLRIGVSISTWDKEDKDEADWHIDDGIADNQDPWFEDLDFPSESMRFDVDDIEYVNKEWQYGDWDDPIGNTGWVPVYLYFQRQSLPSEGESIRILRNEDRKKRKIRSLVVKDFMVYIDDKPVSSVAEWKEDVMFL